MCVCFFLYTLYFGQTPAREREEKRKNIYSIHSTERESRLTERIKKKREEREERKENKERERERRKEGSMEGGDKQKARERRGEGGVWLTVWPSPSLQSGYHRDGVHMFPQSSHQARMISSSSIFSVTDAAAKALLLLALAPLLLAGRPVHGLGSCKEAGLCCSGRDASCVVQKTPANAIIEDLRDTPCYCDHACLKLNDCCPDYRQTCGGKVTIF